MTPTPQAKKIARQFLRTAYGRPDFIHKESQALLKKLWKQIEGSYDQAGDLQKKLKKIYEDLEEAHYKEEQAFVKANPDLRYPADSFNESKEGSKLQGEAKYAEWAQDVAEQTQKAIGDLEQMFSKIGAT